ncbi:hypothetical protein HHI36_000972 [Cryptolaemus montrouzieri]|uniref:Uncharacterized protein n=1 Tax=Cryptolaemus montrouzieri TaxID=559131 RepID=A0ABD2P745_9CUCU
MIQKFIFFALLLSLCLTVFANPLSAKPAVAIPDTAADDILETAESRHGGNRGGYYKGGNNWKHGGGGGYYHGGGGGYYQGGGGKYGKKHWGK